MSQGEQSSLKENKPSGEYLLNGQAAFFLFGNLMHF